MTQESIINYAPPNDGIDGGEPNEQDIHAIEKDYLANIDVDDAFGLYLKEIGRTPLLTSEEEIILAKRIERGRQAREKLAKGKFPAKRKADLRSLIEDGWAARDNLIVANTKLVISVAKKHIGRGVPFPDLVEEGNVGLIRATNKFDYRRGHKFSTYATWWIRQAISRAIADKSRGIRVPVHMNDTINRLYRIQHQLTQSLGREPSVEELADALEIAPKKS